MPLATPHAPPRPRVLPPALRVLFVDVICSLLMMLFIIAFDYFAALRY